MRGRGLHALRDHVHDRYDDRTQNQADDRGRGGAEDPGEDSAEPAVDEIFTSVFEVVELIGGASGSRLRRS